MTAVAAVLHSTSVQDQMQCLVIIATKHSDTDSMCRDKPCAKALHAKVIDKAVRLNLLNSSSKECTQLRCVTAELGRVGPANVPQGYGKLVAIKHA